MRGLELGEGFQRQRESVREASESSGDLLPAPGAARRSLPGLLLRGQGSPEGRRTHLPGLGGRGLWGRASLGAPAGSAGPLPGHALRFAPSIRQRPAAPGRGSHRASSGAQNLSRVGSGDVGHLTATLLGLREAQLRCWDPDAVAHVWCGHFDNISTWRAGLWVSRD